jgi:hypothetical protein
MEPFMSATTAKGQILPALLRAAYPRHTAKLAARAACVPLETARNWVRGRAAPPADTLLRWAARCDALANALETYLEDTYARAEGAPDARAPGAGVAAPPRTRPAPRRGL